MSRALQISVMVLEEKVNIEVIMNVDNISISPKVNLMMSNRKSQKVSVNPTEELQSIANEPTNTTSHTKSD